MPTRRDAAEARSRDGRVTSGCAPNDLHPHPVRPVAAPMGLKPFSVAQIGNLPYRRLVIGRAPTTPTRAQTVETPQDAILRHSRLPVCATNVRNAPNGYSGLVDHIVLLPWVARASQPWALGRSPFGAGKVLSRSLRFLLAVGLALAISTLHAADEPAKKGFFLPQNPIAAAYILGRLSTKELIEAPRSEFVFIELLQRKGLDRKYRLEALGGLAAARKTDSLAELIGGIVELDKKGEESEPVLRELAALLLQTKAADLSAKREQLEKLADEAQLPLGRQTGYAALVTADGSADKTWPQVESDTAKLADLLLSIPLIRDPGQRAALYPKVEPLIHKDDPAEVRRAAITAIAAVPGHDPETFNTLATLVKSGTERAAAIASLQRIPRKAWPKDQAEPLLESLIGYLKSVPVDQRTEPDAIAAFQLATDLSALLPPEKAQAASKTLRAIGVSVFVVRTINEQMLFDKQLIVVEAGKPVEIILINDDAMPHNLVVIMPGALDEIGQAAEKMAPEPDADGRLHVPASPKVLHATRMIDPGQQAKLSFTAPEEPGDYQYVCTFPGHWRRMVGTLAVVKDVEAYLVARAANPEPVITEWKLEDLLPDLPKISAGRNLVGAKETFQKLACVQCHRLGKEGYAYGPDLTDVFKRWKGDRAAVLNEILEPSKVIAERYRNYQFELKNGEEFLGMIVKEDADTVTVQIGPAEALIQTHKKADFKRRELQTSSLMPLGLLNLLSKEQILDLLAYLESGGEVPSAEHQH
jgi:putative heme-binding domain-containing protein